MAQDLCTLLRELFTRGYYYQHLPKLLFYTGDLSHCKLKVVPWDLTRNKVPGCNASLLVEVNTHMAKFLKMFTAQQSATAIYEIIKEQSASCLLDPEYLTCKRGCVHTVTQWWTQEHYMGRTKVTLTPTFREGLYRDFHEIMTEFFKAEKSYHPLYQARPLGFVLFPGSDLIFLVQEAPKYPSLRVFRKAHPSEAPQLFKQLEEAVAFLHTRDIAPLILNPSSIGVAVESSGYTLKLPALAFISQSILADTVRYLPFVPEFRGDWTQVDAGSLKLLQAYLERGEEPTERRMPRLHSDLPLLCTPSRAWTILHTCM